MTPMNRFTMTVFVCLILLLLPWTVSAGCPPHSHPGSEKKISNDTVEVTCNCDAGYHKAGGQCLTRDKAMAVLEREFDFKSTAYRGALDRVKFTANAFGFHIDAMGYESLQAIKPRLNIVIGALITLYVYNPAILSTLASNPEAMKKALATAVTATASALLFVTDVVNDCNFTNFETKSLCANFRMAVLDLQPRFDAVNKVSEEIARLHSGVSPQ